MVGCSGGGDDSSSSPSAPAAKVQVLPVQPIAQQTEVWCWAASAEMIFRYYGLPSLNLAGNYQCGVVAASFGGACYQDCFACVTPIGGMSQMQYVINNYGVVANNFLPSRILSSRLLFGPLSPAAVITEIDAGRPILAGISPSSFSYPNISQHVVVIVGYDTTTPEFRLIVNDPFPYAAFPSQPNPYLFLNGVPTRPGQFSISYNAFVGAMQWGNTTYSIQ
ncbi:C39 family peptidase [Paraburkholderia terrae]|uniref:Peptidase C39-like domain-containing protein n=2 Tax=Paraburkholderia terrae TaxID=311230 RepID=A0A2I8EL90_9BURK|nr:hypothetical protein C2L65_11905 [Paraburkholderia terrae]